MTESTIAKILTGIAPDVAPSTTEHTAMTAKTARKTKRATAREIAAIEFAPWVRDPNMGLDRVTAVK